MSVADNLDRGGVGRERHVYLHLVKFHLDFLKFSRYACCQSLSGKFFTSGRGRREEGLGWEEEHTVLLCRRESRHVQGLHSVWGLKHFP